jgi:hypothetical protein
MSTEALLMTFNSIRQQGTTLSPEMIREYEEVLGKYNEEVLNGSAGNFQTAGYDPDDGPGLILVGRGLWEFGPLNDNVADTYGKTDGRSGKALGAWGQLTLWLGFGEMVNSENYLKSQREQVVTDIFIDCLKKSDLNSSQQDVLTQVYNSKIPTIIQGNKRNGNGEIINSAYGLKPGETVGDQIKNRNDEALDYHVKNLVKNFYSGNADLSKYYSDTSKGWFEQRIIRSDSYSSINKRQFELLKKIQRNRVKP